MSKFVQKTKVLKYIHEKNKRCKANYLYRLDIKIKEIIDLDISRLGQKSTLDLENAELCERVMNNLSKQSKNKKSWKTN